MARTCVGDCDCDYDDEQGTTSGSIGTASGDSTAADTLLEVIGAVAQLHALLAELTPEEFRTIEKRLAALKLATARLPSVPAPKASIGFAKRKR